MEGVAVVGEALHRAAPEGAEFVVEIVTAAPTVAQALQDHKAKIAQIAQTVAPLGVQRTDLQTITLNISSNFGPLLPALPYGAMPQVGPAAFGPFTGGPYPGAAAALQTDVQFGSYQARSLVRIYARDAARVGEIVDTLTKAGANLSSGFSFRVADESAARRSALEAAGRDARAKAESLAQAAGKQVGDPVSIFEDIVVANGAYSALRAQLPFAFGPGTPANAGELEYYARVTTTFRIQ
jgi:uncharacterized protein YggE